MRSGHVDRPSGRGIGFHPEAASESNGPMESVWLEAIIGVMLFGLGLLAGVFRIHIIVFACIVAIMAAICCSLSLHWSGTIASVGLLQIGYAFGLILVGLFMRRSADSPGKQAGNRL